MTGGIKIVTEANLGTYVTNGTPTTSTFTPTTFKSIEQMFVGTEEPEAYQHQAGFEPPSVQRKTYINMDSMNWQQGGVTTVVTPGAAAPPSFELLQPGREEERRAGRGGGRKPRDLEEEALCPEEEERRTQRRERNKLAAARCRKRRVDQTDTLQGHVDEQEDKKRKLQEQIQALQSERAELEFILEAHRAVCSRINSGLPEGPRVVVKEEPEVPTSTTRHLTHAEAMDQPQVTITTTLKMGGKKRPSSLGFSSMASTMSSLNIPIETPTNVMSQLDFNALMDGRTGLTPTNILTPIMVSMSGSSGFLQTPTVATPTCGSQQRSSGGRASMQELGSPSQGAPNLVSL